MPPYPDPQKEPYRQSDDWVKTSLIATVITVVIGIVGFSIQITNLARVYEQRQTTVEVKLLTLQEAVVELKRIVAE